MYVDGNVEPLSRGGTFVGQHIATPLHGVAVQINAFNFPVWGPLEKFAPAFLGGVPSLVKPASQTAYLTARLVELIVASGLLPAGSVQLICGSAGDSARPRDQPGPCLASPAPPRPRAACAPTRLIVRNSVRFNAEADSLNMSVLGPDARPGTAEFDLYVRQLVTEMTVKAGQKCTAIRRAFVPAELMDDVAQAAERAAGEGDRRQSGQPGRADGPAGQPGAAGGGPAVAEGAAQRRADHRLRRPRASRGRGSRDAERGAFISPVLLRADDPDRAEPHEVEAFGPVSTLLPYSSAEQVIELAARGDGSLAGSVVTGDADFAREIVLGVAPWHGRLLVLDAEDAKESTGHGSPLPALVHGGPGRAGGGEELGGIRGRAAPHAAHRRAGQPDHARRGHRPLGAWRPASR